MNISKFILRIAGWKVDLSTPNFPKSIICVAPHTSNWDFILGELAIHSVGRKSGFLMKESWFFFPLGPIFKAMGGVPVPRSKKKGSLTSAVVELFNSRKELNIAITPEGTRKRVEKWHTGFLHIAYEAKIPVQLAVFDFNNKIVLLKKVFTPTGNVTEDINRIKDYYRSLNVEGRIKGRFSTNPQ